MNGRFTQCPLKRFETTLLIYSSLLPRMSIVFMTIEEQSKGKHGTKALKQNIETLRVNMIQKSASNHCAPERSERRASVLARNPKPLVSPVRKSQRRHIGICVAGPAAEILIRFYE